MLHHHLSVNLNLVTQNEGFLEDPFFIYDNKELKMVGSRENKPSSQDQKNLQNDDPIFLYLCALSRYNFSKEAQDEEEKQHRSYAPRQNWQILSDSKEQPGGYRGVAFIHLEKKVIVMAHRGTCTDSSDAMEQNVIADYLIATEQVPEIILNSALQFCDAVYIEMQRNGYDTFFIHQTGFSLGGWLAGMVGAYVAKKLPSITGWTVSIDSPGTFPAAKILIRAGKLADNSAKTIDYIIKPANLVSMCNRRTATTIRTLSHPTLLNHSKPESEHSALSEVQFNHETGIQELFKIVGLLQSHHLNALILSDITKIEFKPETSYLIQKFIPIEGKKPFNLINYIGSFATHAVAASYEMVSRMSSQSQVLIFLGAAAGVYWGQEQISAGILSASQAAKQLQPYQKVLNNLHNQFGVVGVKVGALESIPVLPLQKAKQETKPSNPYVQRLENLRKQVDTVYLKGSDEHSAARSELDGYARNIDNLTAAQAMEMDKMGRALRGMRKLQRSASGPGLFDSSQAATQLSHQSSLPPSLHRGNKS